MRDHLAHHVRQRLVLQRRDRHPAHAVRRAGAGRNARGVNHKLQRKMREHMGDHADPAMPACASLSVSRRLLQRGLVVLRGEPVRTSALRSCRRAGLFRRGCAPATRRRASPRTPRRGAVRRSSSPPCAETSPDRRAQTPRSLRSADTARRPASSACRSSSPDPSAPARCRPRAWRRAASRPVAGSAALLAAAVLPPRTAATPRARCCRPPAWCGGRTRSRQWRRRCTAPLPAARASLPRCRETRRRDRASPPPRRRADCAPANNSRARPTSAARHRARRGRDRSRSASAPQISRNTAPPI